MSSLQDLILLRIGWWISAWSDPFPYSPTDIQRNPSCLFWSAPQASKSVLPQPSSWSPPISGRLKWNVDASFNPRLNRSSIGGVLRNHIGHFICLFSCSIPTMEINRAEVLAIHRAISISLAHDSFQSSLFEIESDSKNAVAWCNGSSGEPWNLNSQLNFIRRSCQSGCIANIYHKDRSSNSVADALAKQGLLRLDNFVAWL